MSESGDLVCNFTKCRKPLTTRAWVTSCLHAFCEEDGSQHVSQTPVKCPTCDTQLSNNLDIIKIELNPSEGFKSMVLAGLKPDIICDIAGRALSFWMYQMSEDRAYLAGAVSRGKRRFDELERFYEKHIRQLQEQMGDMKLHLDKELAASARQLSEAQRDLEAARRQADELSSRLAQRNKQYIQLQRDYDGLRVKTAGVHHRADGGCSPARATVRRAPTPQLSPMPRRVSHISQFVFKPVTPQQLSGER